MYDKSTFHGIDPQYSRQQARAMRTGAGDLDGIVGQIGSMLSQVTVLRPRGRAVPRRVGRRAAPPARGGGGEHPQQLRRARPARPAAGGREPLIGGRHRAEPSTPISLAPEDPRSLASAPHPNHPRRTHPANSRRHPMTQLQSGSFRGSDVDGLDRVVHKMTDAAEFADDVVTALKILATALDMMSWTGWAAAFARYLRAVVIPWVKTVAQYLRGFAKVLALISQTQKDTSSDHPTVHIPASAFQPVILPATSTANAPVLAAPEPGVATSPQGGGAAGAGAQVVVPVSIGSVTVHVHGAEGGGADAAAPTTPTVRTDTAGGATGDGTVGVSAGSIAPGPVSVQRPGRRAARSAVAGRAGDRRRPVDAGARRQRRRPDRQRQHRRGGIGGGTGGGTGGGSARARRWLRRGGGPCHRYPHRRDAGPTPSPVDAGAVPGDPPVSTLPVGLDGAFSDGPGAVPIPAFEGGTRGAGVPVALAAAPLGLAALGASAFGALRAKNGEGSDGGDVRRRRQWRPSRSIDGRRDRRVAHPMSVVQHPGPLLPGGPLLHLDVPDGWHVGPAPRAIAVARPVTSPRLQPGFVPNLTVTADLVPVGTTPDQVLDAMLAQYPGTRDAADGRCGQRTADPGARAAARSASGSTCSSTRPSCPAGTSTPSPWCRAGPTPPPPTCATRSPTRTPPSGSAPPTRSRPDRPTSAVSASHHLTCTGTSPSTTEGETDEQRPRHGHRRRP